jgi:uncharacterized protein GlcG (DUF336 family)
MPHPIACAASIALCLAGTGAASAQGLVTIRKMSAPLANELVGETVAACARTGFPVSAVLVDLDGVRQAVLRGDNAPIHSIDNAFLKAYSAASITLVRKEDSTRAVSERMAKNPPTEGRNLPGLHA